MFDTHYNDFSWFSYYLIWLGEGVGKGKQGVYGEEEGDFNCLFFILCTSSQFH